MKYDDSLSPSKPAKRTTDVSLTTRQGLLILLLAVLFVAAVTLIGSV